MVRFSSFGKFFQTIGAKKQLFYSNMSSIIKLEAEK